MNVNQPPKLAYTSLKRQLLYNTPTLPQTFIQTKSTFHWKIKQKLATWPLLDWPTCTSKSERTTNWNGLTEVNARWNFCFAGSKARVAVVRPCAYLEKTRSEIFGSAPTTLPVPPRYVSLEGSKKNYSFSVCLLFYQYTSKNISIIIMFPNYF